MNINKKLIIECIAAVTIVAVIGVVLFFVLGEPKVDVAQVTSVYVVGPNTETGAGETNILDQIDAERVIEIINGKKKISDNPGKIFSVEDNIARSHVIHSTYDIKER